MPKFTKDVYYVVVRPVHGDAYVRRVEFPKNPSERLTVSGQEARWKEAALEQGAKLEVYSAQEWWSGRSDKFSGMTIL